VLRRPSEATPRPERDSLEWRETVPAQLRDRDIDITTVGDIYRPATPPPAPTTPTLEDAEAAQPVRRRPERIAPHPSHPVEAGVGSGIGEDATQLSPRLRAKLAGSNVERPPKRGLNPMMIAVGSLTVVAVLAFVVFLVGPWSRPKAPSQAPAASQPTVPETTPTATNEVPSAGAPQASAPQPSSPPVASSAPAARPTPGPARSTSPPPSTVATTARTAATTPISSPVKPAAPVRTFGIVVATYINEDRATTEREKLGQSTGLPTRISTAQEDGSEVYRVVVGSFGDRRRAEQAASDLVARGLINEARITSFAP
jgi:cell division protein FtsN